MSARPIGRGPQPPPQTGEVQTAVSPQAHQLAVEQHPVTAESAPDRRALGKLLRTVASGPRAQAHRVPVTAPLETHPIELHLDRPAAADGYRPGTRQHRVDEPRKRFSRGHAASVGEPRELRDGCPDRFPTGAFPCRAGWAPPMAALDVNRGKPVERWAARCSPVSLRKRVEGYEPRSWVLP